MSALINTIQSLITVAVRANVCIDEFLQSSKSAAVIGRNLKIETEAFRMKGLFGSARLIS